ncbi:putative coproporphyrinogen dehydrogenase [Leptospira fainei serovar Hurstbridge str. BUT 6]|uniref:Heme chaperone HemW n=1 Tax=Leptospira fainei serovar Hurstbridge str. BUT 6 TaxID=1193011 RepID=S3V3N2_9LEPT|nr:radical SAM family heme chaperone HemW [Leptospira fainei]EPG76003.1 putative coproporphyrinogen dehydrogenase [Leptospira fainei serovar Hurstbridge str. BUT 6]
MDPLLPTIKKTGKSGVYVHYPFCIKKCSYCDFYSEGIGLEPSPLEKDLFRKYEQETVSRLEASPQHSELSFDTVFFGGGTPSKASPERYADFLNFLKNNIDLADNAEISLECNPEDLTDGLLRELSDAGVNRVHIGIQSFQPRTLKFLDRYYDPENYPKVLEIVSESKIKNFGADLMFGVPNQTEEEFYADAELILSAGVSHISLYALTVEKGTEYSRSVISGRLPPPQEEIQERILKDLPEILRRKNFQQYEVSNYSKPGFYSRHNMKYWTYEYYLGIGPGAHGFLPSGRYSNQRNTNAYLKGNRADIYERPTPFEELILSLFRVFLPVELDEFLKLIPEKAPDLLKKLREKSESGLSTLDGTVFQWKPEAVLFLDAQILDLAQI